MSTFLNSMKSFAQSPTEMKIKQATDENENFGATATLMNEMSVLTYSPKTLKEIIQVLRKKLMLGHNKRTIGHKSCVMLLKTLTLVSYIMNNGSNDFVSWVKSNSDIFNHLTTLNPSAADKKSDINMINQIVLTSKDITRLIDDEELLEQRRRDVVQFRSSISSPGRKSTDNSHLKTNNFTLNRSGLEKFSSPNSPTASSARVPANQPINHQRTSRSLDLRTNPNPLRNTGEYSRTALDPLTEEVIGNKDSTTINSTLNDLQGINFTGSQTKITTQLRNSLDEVEHDLRSRFKSNAPVI